MRLLLDENVGIRRWAELLTAAGHDVERVVDVGLQGASDTEVVAYAIRPLFSKHLGTKGGRNNDSCVTSTSLFQ